MAHEQWIVCHACESVIRADKATKMIARPVYQGVDDEDGEAVAVYCCFRCARIEPKEEQP